MEIMLFQFSTLLIIVVFVLIVFILWLVPVKLWIQALSSGVHVGLLSLIGMRLRLVNPHRIILPLIRAVKAGLKISVNEIETHFLAGGNVMNVVNGLVSSFNADIPLSFEKAAAIDLAGRNISQAVKMSVEPAVIDCPDPESGTAYISAVAQDGIQLKVKARVTVRANLEKLVGGATEETVIARVGEGIVSSIGSAADHTRVLENPDIISKRVLNKGLDAGTAFSIISIDIADIDVGRNIGSELQISQANADKQVAQAKAEERRAMALARAQEMKVKGREMSANLIAAEAEVPMAQAEAIRKGWFRIAFNAEDQEGGGSS